MGLLTDDDKALLVLEHLGPAALAGDTMSLYDCFQLALALAEGAVLKKLASAELPANAPHITRRIRACESEVPALIVFEHAWRQAYAQGAASQLAEKPSAYELSATKYANGRELVYTVPDALASYIKVEPLYTRREA